MGSYELFVADFGLHDLGLNETQDTIFKNVLCILFISLLVSCIQQQRKTFAVASLQIS